MFGCNLPEQHFQFFLPLMLIVDVSAILLNGLIAYVLKKYKKTNIVTFWFIYCLSISDILVGVSGLMFHLVQLKLLVGHPNAFWVSFCNAAAVSENYFLATSGRLIFITAIDRCIHMKFLNKYSVIMTQSKGRWIMFSNVVFGILTSIPLFVASEKFAKLFYFGITIIHTALTLFIYAIYIKIYCFSIKRKIASLKICNVSHTALHQPRKRSADQCKSLNKQYCGKYLDAKGCDTINCVESLDSAKSCVITGNDKIFEPYDKVLSSPSSNKANPSNSVEKPNSYRSCVLARDNKVLEPDGKAFLLTNANEAIPSKSFRESRKLGDMKTTRRLSNFVENAIVCPVTNTEREKIVVTRQATLEQKLDSKTSQKSQTRKATPEQDFRKATIFIFLALFICYFPTFIQNFYAFATRGGNFIFSYISEICVLLNSSLNAIILIIFSKEIQRNIKAIFQQN